MLGYFWVDFFFVTINIIGILLHLSLYFIDKWHYDSILDRVSGKKEV